MAASYPSFVVCLIAGSLFFPGVLMILCRLIDALQFLAKENIDRTISVAVSVRLTSIIQAIFAVAIGYMVIKETYHDVIDARSGLVEVYASFGVPYMISDVAGMYLIHKEDHQLQDVPFKRAVSTVLSKDWVLIGHHLIVAFVFYPMVMLFRKGNFFIGCFFMTELSTPSLNLRKIFLKLGMTDSFWFRINNVIFTITFFVCRILLIPFMYWVYAHNKQLSMYEALTTMKLACHVSCASILAMQFMWLSMFMKSLTKKRKNGGRENGSAPNKQLIIQEPIALLSIDKID